MKTHFILGTTAFALLALTQTPLAAQQPEQPPITVEARGGYAVPFGTFSDQGAQSDFGWGASVIFGVAPNFGIYGGWARDVFHCERCGPNNEIRASGFELGGKFLIPADARVSPWVKAGLLAPRGVLRTGVSEFESSRNIGVQGAIGMDARLSEHVSLTPAVRVNSFTSEFEGLEGNGFAAFQPRTDFRYFSFDLGLQIHP